MSRKPVTVRQAGACGCDVIAGFSTRYRTVEEAMLAASVAGPAAPARAVRSATAAIARAEGPQACPTRSVDVRTRGAHDLRPLRAFRGHKLRELFRRTRHRLRAARDEA